jgi:hypothetical protein
MPAAVVGPGLAAATLAAVAVVGAVPVALDGAGEEHNTSCLSLPPLGAVQPGFFLYSSRLLPGPPRAGSGRRAARPARPPQPTTYAVGVDCEIHKDESCSERILSLATVMPVITADTNVVFICCVMR